MAVNFRWSEQGRATQRRGIGNFVSFPFSSRNEPESPEFIRPGHWFKEPDGTVWKIVRDVHFRIDPAPHFELLKIRPAGRDQAKAQKVISEVALRDRSLFRFAGSGDDAS
jgi:hypothetical protein